MLILNKPAGKRTGDWDTEEDRWLREVVQRLEGTPGLEKVARSTRRAGDVRAWCKSLTDAGDWKAALTAFEEAAEIVTDEDYTRGELLDGAALAAQILELEDVAAHLERAWRANPSLPRLRRWLGSSNSKVTLEKRVAGALEVCPTDAAAQRMLLHLLSHDFGAAAKLLASAPGLGWSSGEHPGHMSFLLLARLLRGLRTKTAVRTDIVSDPEMDPEELEAMTADSEKPRLVTLEVDSLLALAGIDRISDVASRTLVLAAMKKAAESRVAGVTDQKRRRHYRHAAELVATCLACDSSSATAGWAAALKAEYRRFPALREELDRAMGAP